MKKFLTLVVIVTLYGSVFAFENQFTLGFGYGIENLSFTPAKDTKIFSETSLYPSFFIDYNGFITKRFGFNVKFQLMNGITGISLISGSPGATAGQFLFTFQAGASIKFDIKKFTILGNAGFGVSSRFFEYKTIAAGTAYVHVYDTTSFSFNLGFYGLYHFDKMWFAKFGFDLHLGGLVGNYTKKEGDVIVAGYPVPVTELYSSSFLCTFVPSLAIGIRL